MSCNVLPVVEKGRLRADAERSARLIMAAAERVLSANPTATTEQIAEAAGVARVTVHRRFASREALVEAMETTAWQEIDAAIEAARPHTAPPLVALHQATANILRIKSTWRFALSRPVPLSERARAVQADTTAKCEAIFVRLRQGGVFAPQADTAWLRRVYLALLGEAAHGTASGLCAPADADPDALATLVIDTLLYGAAPR